MFPKNPRCNEVDLLVLCHFDLRLGIQINHHEFWPVIFENNDMAFLLGQFYDFGKIPVCSVRVTIEPVSMFITITFFVPRILQL